MPSFRRQASYRSPKEVDEDAILSRPTAALLLHFEMPPLLRPDASEAISRAGGADCKVIFLPPAAHRMAPRRRLRAFFRSRHCRLGETLLFISFCISISFNDELTEIRNNYDDFFHDFHYCDVIFPDYFTFSFRLSLCLYFAKAPLSYI